MIISVIPRLVVSLLIYSLIPILLNLASIKLTNYIADSKWGINVNDFRIGFYHKTCKEMFKKDISAIYESSIYQNELKNAIEQDEILQKQLQNEQNVLYKKIKDEYSAYSNDYDAKLKIIQLNINDIEGQYITAHKAVENNPCLHKDQKNIRFVSILLDLFTHMRASTIQEAVNIAKNDSDMEIFKGMFQNYHDKLLTIQKEYLSTMNNISEDIRDMRNMQRETLSCMQRIDNNTQIISGQLDFNTKAIINATKEQTNTLQNIGKNSNLSN